MLAAEKKADFIVSLAGMVVSGKETLLWQNRVSLAKAGIPAETIETYCNALEAICCPVLALNRTKDLQVEREKCLFCSNLSGGFCVIAM